MPPPQRRAGRTCGGEGGLAIVAAAEIQPTGIKRLWDTAKIYTSYIVGVDPISAKALANVIAIWYGLGFLMPWTAFAPNPPFRVIALIFTEWEFGLILIVLGGAGLWALASRRRPWIRRLALVHVFLWSFLTYVFFVGAPSAPAGWITLGLAGGMMWAYVRLR